MTFIVEFLNARFDEDEAVANEVKDPFPEPPSKHPDDYRLHVQDDDYRHDTIVIARDRVLAEVEAKRRLLDEHSLTNDSVCSTCVTGRWGYPSYGDADPQSYPCRTLRLLAAPFAHHPDFDPDWRVG